jgi:hypothetical protein
MFAALHGWATEFQRTCACRCGACQAVGRLTLKVVAHAGRLGFTTVHQHRKPFGEAVVVLHRLLKNDVPSHEYLLLTDDLLGAEWSAAAAWAGAQHQRASYAGLGTVGYVHVSLRPPGAAPTPASAAFSFRGLWEQLVARLRGRPALN